MLIHKPWDTRKKKSRNKGEKLIKAFQPAAIMPFQRNYTCGSIIKQTKIDSQHYKSIGYKNEYYSSCHQLKFLPLTQISYIPAGNASRKTPAGI